MFSYVTLEQRIPEDHPLRKIRAICERALRRMEPVLATMYAERGRPSIAPERLLRAQLLMVLYSIRWETQLMEQINFNLLYRWFVGLGMDDGVWETSVFSKNRERLIAAAQASQAGTAEERRTALKMLARLKRRKRMTLGADKSYQEKSFIAALRAAGVSQHVAEYKPNAQWPTWLSDEERKDPGMAVSQKKRKLVEKPFAWMKQDRPMRQVKLRGLTRVDWLFRICAAAPRSGAAEQVDPDSGCGLIGEKCLWGRKNDRVEMKNNTQQPSRNREKRSRGRESKKDTAFFSKL